MGKIWRWFLQGMALMAAVALTLARLICLGTWSEKTFGGLIKALLPEGFYFKGLGLLSGFAMSGPMSACSAPYLIIRTTKMRRQACCVV